MKTYSNFPDLGFYEIGTPTTKDGRWYRYDTYHSLNSTDSQGITNRFFASGEDDFSPAHNSMPCYGGEYDSRCSCCYLQIGHTHQRHLDNVSRA